MIVFLTICLLFLPFSTSLTASMIPAHASVSSDPTILSYNLLTDTSLNTNNYVNVDTLFNFTLTVLPTMILTPSNGPIFTSVSVQAYGFPSNIDVYLYWYQDTYGDLTYYLTNNATTGSNGEFNTSVVFTVPHTYGGVHPVEALSKFLGKTTTSVSDYEIWGATFTVTQQITISSSSFRDGKSTSTSSKKSIFDSVDDKIAQAILALKKEDYPEVLSRLITALEMMLKDKLKIPTTITKINISKIIDIMIAKKIGPYLHLAETKKACMPNR